MGIVDRLKVSRKELIVGNHSAYRRGNVDAGLKFGESISLSLEV